MIGNLVRKQILDMQEINWGDVPDNTGMRLLWGENPNAPKEVFDVLEKEIKKINLYPSPTKNRLKELLALYNDVKAENIVPTNGSDGALELIAKVFIAENDELIIPVPSYPCFTSVSQMMGAKNIYVPLGEDFSLDTKKIVSKITKKTKIVWIANPNNPTGNILISQDELESFIKQIPCIVVFDECYFEFAKVSAATLIDKYPNIIVTRSFTKAFGLAGVRLGYIIASKEAVQYLNKLEQTNLVFNINRFALVAGEALLKNKNAIDKSINSFLNLKSNFEKLLSKVNGIRVIPTKTSFCLLDTKSTSIPAKELKEQLSKRGIYIKDCSIYQELGDFYAYLGVPDQKYQEKVISEIEKVIERE